MLRTKKNKKEEVKRCVNCLKIRDTISGKRCQRCTFACAINVQYWDGGRCIISTCNVCHSECKMSDMRSNCVKCFGDLLYDNI
jgi:hypothetical protein